MTNQEAQSPDGDVRETVRVAFGWSNYRDFATLQEAEAFIAGWKRPDGWPDLYLDPHIIKPPR